jgi:hypothetical protein
LNSTVLRVLVKLVIVKFTHRAVLFNIEQLRDDESRLDTPVQAVVFTLLNVMFPFVGV